MDHLIALQVEKPVTRTGGLCNVGLMGMLHPPGVFVQVPAGMDDPDLVRTDAFDLLIGPIIGITVPEGDDKLVHQRENGRNSLLYRVIEFGRIAYHGKSAYRHSPVFMNDIIASNSL